MQVDTSILFIFKEQSEENANLGHRYTYVLPPSNLDWYVKHLLQLHLEVPKPNSK